MSFPPRVLSRDSREPPTSSRSEANGEATIVIETRLALGERNIDMDRADWMGQGVSTARQKELAKSIASVSFSSGRNADATELHRWWGLPRLDRHFYRVESVQVLLGQNHPHWLPLSAEGREFDRRRGMGRRRRAGELPRWWARLLVNYGVIAPSLMWISYLVGSITAHFVRAHVDRARARRQRQARPPTRRRLLFEPDGVGGEDGTEHRLSTFHLDEDVRSGGVAVVEGDHVLGVPYAGLEITPPPPPASLPCTVEQPETPMGTPCMEIRCTDARTDCVVCMFKFGFERPRYLLMPCQHARVCKLCALTLWSSMRPRCPECNTQLLIEPQPWKQFL